MSENTVGVALKEENNRLSLMYTLHAISHLSKDEFGLLKELRRNKSLRECLNKEEIEMHPKIKKILDDFNLKSIQEVIDIVEDYKLFELYHF